MKNYFYIRYTNGMYVNDADGSIHAGWHPEEVIPFEFETGSDSDFPGKKFVERFTKDYDKKDVFPFRTDNVYINQKGKNGTEYICYVETDNKQLAVGKAARKVIAGMEVLEEEKRKQLKERTEKFADIFKPIDDTKERALWK